MKRTMLLNMILALCYVGIADCATLTSPSPIIKQEDPPPLQLIFTGMFRYATFGEGQIVKPSSLPKEVPDIRKITQLDSLKVNEVDGKLVVEADTPYYLFASVVRLSNARVAKIIRNYKWVSFGQAGDNPSVNEVSGDCCGVIWSGWMFRKEYASATIYAEMWVTDSQGRESNKITLPIRINK